MLRQASAIRAVAVIEDEVRRKLRRWEDSDELPSEAAHDLVRVVLGHQFVNEAMRELKHPRAEIDGIGACCD